MTMSSSKFESEAVNFAQQAVLFDQEGKTDAAVYFYTEAAASLIEALKYGSKVMGLKDKAAEYVGRAEELKRIRSQSNQMATLKSSQQLDSERAEFLLKHAFEEDENGNKDEAVDLYMEAAELCLQARKNIDDKTLMAKLAKLAEQALERAEQLKNIAPPINRSSSPRTVLRSSSPHAVKTNPARTVPILGFNFLSQGTSTVPVQHVAPSPKKPQVSGSSSYTKEEIDVLRLTSLINGREYVPFMSVDLKERFAYPVPFSDRDGKLTLAPKQKSNFLKWVRPEDFCSEPKIIDRIDCFSIKQTVVSDCSFVASLAISALYEKRFNKKLITRIIYPQNKNGEPVYNPCGKYMVKLHINGIPRKIIIDDYLPMGADGGLLCSFSTNRNELWISLLEKAYMKVMGGYDFPGSNSNIDLHALTGWIPERIGIRPGTPEFNKDGIFNKILERFHKGDVLLTMATGEIPEGEANRAGLVPTHAYALLDVQEVKGKKLILLKNPWMHLRWKGNFSDRDEVNWTKDLMDALRYNPRSAQQIDNGVFWIDWDSVCHFFDVIYMNWNPGMFKYTYCIHQSWKAGMGPIKDVYNISDNPQFKLEVKATPGCAVWILLTRHITDKEDFAQNKEYITVLIYKTEGKKIYYPHDPPPYIDGIRINSPHYLAKIKFDSAGTFLYTLVVSQYEKMNTIYYTLRVFSTNEFLLSKIPNPYKFKEEVTSQWKGITAGGCANNPNTYRNNPTFQINLDNSLPDNSLLIDLKGPKQYQVGFDVVMVTQKCSDVPGFSRKSSGIFRSGFCVLALDNVPGGTYNVIPSTFHPGQESPFFLTIQASCQFKVSRIQ